MASLWIRIGDADSYGKMDDDIEGTAELVGLFCGNGRRRWRDGGVEIEPEFVGHNYVSLYWGDDDAGWERDLSAEERAWFEQVRS